MRIKLSHRIAFGFAEPIRNLTYILKLTPRSHDGQRVMRWRIDIEPECRLKACEDHFGNLTHTLTIPGPVLDPRVTVSGEIANYRRGRRRARFGGAAAGRVIPARNSH